jgi:hypothetical protein
MGVWVFIAFAVVIVTLFLVSESRRQESLARVASQLGFAFTPGQHRLPGPIDAAGFYLFTQGQPDILNRLDGERRGYRASVFGFGYDAGFGDEGSRELLTADDGRIDQRLQTVVWLHRPGQRLPDFDLSPTGGPMRRTGPRVGLGPVGIDGHADFRAHYVLAGRDAGAVRRLFTPAVLEAFVADRGWTIEGRGDQWLVYRLEHRVAAEQVPAYLDQAIALVERLSDR